MIDRFNDILNYNPIREHLRIIPRTLDDKNEVIDKIRVELLEDLEGRKSRAIIFCSTRKKTEDVAEILSNSLPKPLSGKIASFHAGMSSEDRNNIYVDYLKGDISILVATKAFGMGMDIPNIHHIYHFDPPSSLEDYLQEVGRGGRDQKALSDAGFSIENPIECHLFATSESFRNKRNLIHKSAITWNDVITISNNIIEYYNKVNPQNSIIPISNNYLDQVSEYHDRNDKRNLLRLALYWLEVLKRIEVGNYLPIHLEFENKKITLEGTNDKEKGILGCYRFYQKLCKRESIKIQISSVELFNSTHFNSYSELFKVLAEMQAKGIIKVSQSLFIKINDWMLRELQYIEENNEYNYLNLSSYLEVAERLLKLTSNAGLVELDQEYLNQILTEIFSENFSRDKMPWMNDDEYSEKIEKIRKSFIKPWRIKSIINLLNSINGLSIKIKITENGKNIYIRNNNIYAIKELRDYGSFCNKVLIAIYKSYKQQELFNVFEKLIDLKIPDYNLEFLENIIVFLKGIGYINLDSPLLHMGIEVKVLSTDIISGAYHKLEDGKIEKVFYEYNYLRRLRVYALEILFGLENEDDLNNFITNYFICNNSEDILLLFEEFIPKGIDIDHILPELRKEALEKELYGELDDLTGKKKGGLNDEQMEIYNVNFSENICVIAGPGTGKTHTLIMRIVRLIYEYGENPEKIIVLAYNRAIVNELKFRINQLLRKLGYGNLAKRLKIHTFHSLAKYVLREALNDIPLNKWITEFNKKYEEEKGTIVNRLNPKYFFVDEYQDITKDKLLFLNNISEGKPTMVIGDPDQSIYGYERKKEGGAIGAEEYFNLFIKEKNAKEKILSKNYRSYQDIITNAENVVELNVNRIRGKEIKAEKYSKLNHTEIIEISELNYVIILDKIFDVIRQKREDGKVYKDCVILFRSNSEIYKFYSLLKKDIRFSDKDILIQGTASNFFKIREVAYFVDKLSKNKNKKIDNSFLIEIENSIKILLAKFNNWDIKIFENLKILISEFYRTKEANATVGDLLDYFEEMRNINDAGIYKLFQLEQNGEISSTKIILSSFHKAKGLEFDAVVVPFSIVNLPFNEKDGAFFDEERRLIYVGMTRAKEKLIRFVFKREIALNNNECFDPEKSDINNIGIPCKFDLTNIYISYSAKTKNINELGYKSFQDYMKYLGGEISQGDDVVFERKNGKWFVVHNSKPIMALTNYQLVGQLNKYSQNTFNGILCGNIIRYTYEETLAYDKKNSSNFADGWCEEAKEIGFIYLVEFEGYAN